LINTILKLKVTVLYVAKIRKYVFGYTNYAFVVLCRNCLLKQVIEGKIKGEMEVTRR